MVTEIPKDLVIRTNGTIVLSAPPVSGSDVMIYVNGISLIPGKEFSVSGNTITFLRDLDHATSDVVHIKYQSQFAPAVSRETRRDINTDLIARDALIRSVINEHTPGAVPEETQSDVSRATASTRTQNGNTELRSLHLLVRDLNAGQNHYSARINTARASRGSTQGVEGIGDASTKNNYGLILGVPDGDLAERLINSRSADPVRNLRSLRMLQQRLDGTGAH